MSAISAPSGYSECLAFYMTPVVLWCTVVTQVSPSAVASTIGDISRDNAPYIMLPAVPVRPEGVAVYFTNHDTGYIENSCRLRLEVYSKSYLVGSTNPWREYAKVVLQRHVRALVQGLLCLSSRPIGSRCLCQMNQLYASRPLQWSQGQDTVLFLIFYRARPLQPKPYGKPL